MLGSQRRKATAKITVATDSQVSAVIAISGCVPLKLVMPAAWTAADITLQDSEDGVTFQDVYDQYGSQVTLKVAQAQNIILDPSMMMGLGPYLKIRSTVAQASDRVITVVSRPIA